MNIYEKVFLEQNLDYKMPYIENKFESSFQNIIYTNAY
jgi:hypothetical protein